MQLYILVFSAGKYLKIIEFVPINYMIPNPITTIREKITTTIKINPNVFIFVSSNAILSSPYLRTHFLANTF